MRPVWFMPKQGAFFVANFHRLDEGTKFSTLVIKKEQSESSRQSVNTPPKALLGGNPQTTEQTTTEQALTQQSLTNTNLEELTYIISHDLQEPLRAMTAFSQLLQQRYGEQLDSSARQYITHIVHGGHRMKAMIDGVLELSRIHRTQAIIPVSLEQALAAALKNLKCTRRERQATVTHDPLPTLLVNKHHIVQLFQNLIGNAIKFQGEDPPCVHLAAKEQAHGWLFSVQDNGIGIPHDQQKNIFKLFQRLHSQHEYQGYGIGLAICKKILEHYHGNLWITSVPGEGAVFYFTLLV